MRIGFVTIWFERGQAYITRTFLKALESHHELFVFARTGNVFGVDKMAYGDEWEVPNLTRYPKYKIEYNDLINWVKDNKIDILVYNEEYDFELVYRVKEATGVKSVTYLDFYAESWEQYMGVYDQVWCSTKRAYNLVKPICNAEYISWGVDTEMFKPEQTHKSKSNLKSITAVDLLWKESFNDSNKCTFFHNAGWLGNGYRKMTPFVITAFHFASKENLDISLFIHSQVGLEKLPPAVNVGGKEITMKEMLDNDRLIFHVETLQHPGLYHRGKVLIFVSKLEGLGLPLIEGLSCGLPAIVVDEPPMNEFVTDGFNGDVIPVIQRIARQDNIAFPEAILNTDVLIEKMVNYQDRITKSKNARKFIEDDFTLDHLRINIERAIDIWKL